MSKRRVVVTGLGLISPVGNTVTEGWNNVRDGVSGIGPIEQFDASAFTTRFAGTIRNFDLGQYLEPKEARKCDQFMHYGIAASMQAMQDSGLTVDEANAHRYGVAMGSGIGGISTIEANYAKLAEGGPRKISPFFVPGTIINMISGHVSIKYGLTGPNFAVVTACTTSTHCIGLAARLIQSGDADFMLAGGARVLDDAIGSRRLLRGESSVDAQRRPQAREPAMGSRPRRIRAQRRRRLHRARRLRARQSARGAHLRRVRRLRHERRRLSHHRAAGERAGRLSMHAQRHARRRVERRRRSAT